MGLISNFNVHIYIYIYKGYDLDEQFECVNQLLINKGKCLCYQLDAQFECVKQFYFFNLGFEIRPLILRLDDILIRLCKFGAQLNVNQLLLINKKIRNT